MRRITGQARAAHGCELVTQKMPWRAEHGGKPVGDAEHADGQASGQGLAAETTHGRGNFSHCGGSKQTGEGEGLAHQADDDAAVAAVAR